MTKIIKKIKIFHKTHFNYKNFKANRGYKSDGYYNYRNSKNYFRGKKYQK